MNRRDFLNAGAAVAGAVSAFGAAGGAIAQMGPPAKNPAPPTPPAKFIVHGYSAGTLNRPEQLIETCKRSGLEAFNVVCRDGRYIDPANVARDMPRFVNALRSAGIAVQCYTANIYDADTPHAEAIMDAAAQLGLHRYRSGTLYYDRSKPIPPQVEALKPRFAKLNRLLEKYKQNAMYHLYSDPNTVGSSIWDLMEVMKDYSPENMSFHWDTGHMVAGRGINTWELDMRRLGPYIGGVSIKDLAVVPNVGPAAEAYLRDYRDGLIGQCPAAPIGCTGTPGKWRKQWMPLGQGFVDLPVFGALLKEIRFAGTIEIHLEYAGDGFEERIEAYRGDLGTLKAAWAPLGLV